MDMTPLLPVAAGAALAGVFALLGAWIQARREHSRWVRDKRLAAYLSFLHTAQNVVAIKRRLAADMATAASLRQEQAAIERRLNAATTSQQAKALRIEVDSVRERAMDLGRAMTERAESLKAIGAQAVEAGTAFTLLGPAEVHDASMKFHAASDWKDESAALIDLNAVMRKALSIRY